MQEKQHLLPPASTLRSPGSRGHRGVCRERQLRGIPASVGSSSDQVRLLRATAAGSLFSLPRTTDLPKEHQHQRASHQRPHSGSRSAVGWPQRRTGRHRARRRRAASGRRGRPRPRRGGPDGQASGRQAHGLRQVQVRSGTEGARSPQEPGQHGHQGDQAPPEDRPARLRHQEGPRRALPQGRRQGQGDDHVPRPRAVASRAGFRLLQRLAAGRPRAGHRRVRAQAGRPQHDHGAGSDEEEVRGHGRAASRAQPTEHDAATATRLRPRPSSGRRSSDRGAGRSDRGDSDAADAPDRDDPAEPASRARRPRPSRAPADLARPVPSPGPAATPQVRRQQGDRQPCRR